MIESNDNLEWFKRTYPVAYGKAMKHKSNQTFMGEVAKQPPGMPRPDVIRTEVIRQSLSKADADYLIDHWLGNGFMTGRHKVKDWKAVIRKWKTERWFPSQKNSKDQTEEDRVRMSKEMKELRKIHDNGDRGLL